MGFLKALLTAKVNSWSINRINSLQCFDTVGWAAGRASGL